MSRKSADNSGGVGYGNPPLETRFKPGRSGNPNGRPRGSRNLSSDLQEVLEETMTIKEAGKKRKISKQRAMVMSLMARAIKGDIRAANTLFAMISRLLPEEQVEEEATLRPDDLKLLQEFEKGGLTVVQPKERDDE